MIKGGVKMTPVEYQICEQAYKEREAMIQTTTITIDNQIFGVGYTYQTGEAGISGPDVEEEFTIHSVVYNGVDISFAVEALGLLEEMDSKLVEKITEEKG
jgi:hypothetical protein